MSLTAIVSSGLLWASYVRLLSRIPAWSWLESKPLTVTGIASPGLSLLGLAAAGLVLWLTDWRQASPRGKRLAWAGFGLSLAGLTVLYPWWQCGVDLAKRSVCAANLGGIAKNMRMYASAHRGKYPEDLESLLRMWPDLENALVCPGAGEVIPENRYGYIPGSWKTGDPRNVILYEKRWNHLSDGGNVLFANLYGEWVQPYSRVEEMVEQTRQRLAAQHPAASRPAEAN